jgi:hypothetical protein
MKREQRASAANQIKETEDLRGRRGTYVVAWPRGCIYSDS